MLLNEWPGVLQPGLKSVLPSEPLLVVGSSQGSTRLSDFGLVVDCRELSMALTEQRQAVLYVTVGLLSRLLRSLLSVSVAEK